MCPCNLELLWCIALPSPPPCPPSPKKNCRQANWRLDPPLRRACRSDVADICKAEDSRASETGDVYKCLVHNYEDLDPGCKKELGRAVHMAFFVWSERSVLTHPCDGDVAEFCLKNRPNMDRTPGGVGTCLAEIVSTLEGCVWWMWAWANCLVAAVRGVIGGVHVCIAACWAACRRQATADGLTQHTQGSMSACCFHKAAFRPGLGWPV